MSDVNLSKEKPVLPKRLPEAGGAARRSGGPPWMGAAMPAEKAMTFGPSARRLLNRLRPERARVLVVLLLALASVALTVTGPKILGQATDVIFKGYLGARLPGGISLDQAVAAARARGDDDFADLLLRSHAVPGMGIDFGALDTVLLWALARVRRRRRAVVAAGLPAQRRGAEHRAPAAHRRRRQAQPAAAALRRLAAARRTAQPGHQRHRQHRAEPAADAEPARHVAAHGRRRRRGDVPDLAAARIDRAGHHPRHHARDQGHRQTLAAEVHRAVEGHRTAQRAHRGGVHRSRDRARVRPPAARAKRPSRAPTTRCSRPAGARSSSAASSCRR